MRSIFCLMAVLLLAGCISERPASSVELACPWREDGAPETLHRLADDLSACQAATGRLPVTLAQLDGSGIATGGPYTGSAYVYHATGIGVLRDGWRVLAADDRVRSANHVWCVLRPPVRVSGSPPLSVALVPVIELRTAAAAAGSGR